jgi:lysozyme family protein
MDFDTAFEKVIGHEGGYGNDARDPGKATKFGISKKSYPNEDIPNLTLARAKELYRRDYWDCCHTEDLPPGLRHFYFDTAVNCGAGWAVASLQRALGLLPDAQFGPKTYAAVKAASPLTLLRLMFVDRCMVYALSPNDSYFGHGWFGRMFDVTALAVLAIDPRLGG